MPFNKFLYTAILCILTVVAHTEVVNYSGGRLVLGHHLQILTADNGQFTPNAAFASSGYITSISETPNFGVSKHTYWFKFTITNTSSFENCLLELAYPNIDTAALYYVNANFKLLHLLSDNTSFTSRVLQHQHFIFPLQLPKGASKTFLLKVNCKEQLIVPLLLMDNQTFLEASFTKELLAGIHMGVLLVMMFYNLFVFFSVKEKEYLYYVIYILFIGLTQTTLLGYTFKYLWPDFPHFNNAVFIIFPAFAGIAAILFVRDFLQTKNETPIWDKVMLSIILFYAAAVIARLTGFDSLSYRMIDITGALGALLTLVIAINLSLKKKRHAQIFLFAWSIFLLGLILFTLRNFNLLPYNLLTNYTMQLGTAVEVLVLSIALADKINLLKKEKEVSQEKEFATLKENERIVQNQKDELEKEVTERTAALKRSNDDLKNTLNQLKEAQSQLIESEKMASLGQLTAGIAHEINNPINFVSANIKPLRRDIKDLLEVLDAYDGLNALNDTDAISTEIQNIQRLKDQLDVPYLRTELEMLLNGMQDGAQRTVEIVKGLKIFSRIDNLDLNSVNINEGVESTLVLLNNQMTSQMKLIKNLGSLPDVQCYPGKMNQVFMNILTNAIHAVLEKPDKTEPPTIWVSTALEDDNHVKITIKDNGNGMTPTIKAKIFDPFFTTKEVGQGTGLGLSIVYKIIEAHEGSIKVNTEAGVGTEFVITIPISRK